MNNIFSEYYTDIKKIISNVSKNSEFEFDLNKNKDTTINYEKYINLLKYLSGISKRNKYEFKEILNLDINYSQIFNDKRITYRITINDKTLINKYISQFSNKNNLVIFEILLKNIINKHYENEIKIYKKIKSLNNKDETDKTDKTNMDIDNLNIRIRLATEEDLSNKEINDLVNNIKDRKNELINVKNTLNKQDNFNIVFRLKQRCSVILENNNKNQISIDLTKTKTTNKIQFVKDNKTPTYELEVECFVKNKLNDSEIEIILNKMIKEIEILIKIIQSSNFILTENEKNDVYNEYNNLFGHTKTPLNTDNKNVTSLEIQYLDNLPNQYAVTDKADGEHAFIFIIMNKAYIITQNMHVRNTGIILNKEQEKYNKSVLDGELIFLPKHNRYIFMTFDCLFISGENIRNKILLMERLMSAENIIKNCFVFKKQLFDKIEYSNDVKINDKIEFYKKSLDKYFNVLNNDILIEKQHPLIRPKYFIPCSGLQDNEIYKYSQIFWNKYIYEKQKNNYPYNLDGLVYQPLNQQYETNPKQKDLKWKPPTSNSIDFYIEFKKNPKTGKIYNVYDNVENEIIEGTFGEDEIKNINDDKEYPTYKICQLHVGKIVDNKEIPVIFDPIENNINHDAHIAYINTKTDGIIKDVEGNIIQDKTVVEFYYDNSLNISEKFRWIPLRTRHDKTEIVNTSKRKYGNNEYISHKIWNSIKYPIIFSDIENLANDDLYVNQHEKLLNMVSSRILEESKRELYYNVNQNIAEIIKPQTNFHNMIKTMLITCYLSTQFNNGIKKTIFDVACGEGGDLYKFYQAHVKSVVGIDNNFNNLHSTKGALFRYNDMKKKKPNVPKMEFINGDFTIPLNSIDQLQVISDKTPENKKLIIRYFDEKYKFDGLNIQFAFHYFLRNETTWNNTINNINLTLKDGGYLVMTTFDAEKIDEILNENNGQYTQHINVNEVEIVFHDIIKKYETQKIYKFNNAIDVHVSRFMEPGSYMTEYLVDKRFIIPELKEKCNLELIDTELFENVYNNIDSYINIITNYENKISMKEFLEKLKLYYDMTNDINKECFKITKLNRYYVFRKNEK
jgi:acylphosphatase